MLLVLLLLFCLWHFLVVIVVFVWLFLSFGHFEGLLFVFCKTLFFSLFVCLFLGLRKMSFLLSHFSLIVLFRAVCLCSG